ncbi:MAG: hypothetical protein GXP25_12230 [Planctomycetes bacterium]|nr:hypothetical protein [Planctomycetota bacterium]
MQDVIKHMLEVEEKANSIVQAAQTSAREIRMKAQEDARQRLQLICQKAQEDANQIVEAAREEARKQKQDALKDAEVDIQRLRERSKAREDEAIRAVVDTLLAD